MMALAKLPKRLVLCLDGEGVKPDASATNIQRIYSSIRSGRCLDPKSSTWFNQIPQYIAGSSAEGAAKLQASVLGQEHIKQIQDAYESCCTLDPDRDEICLFGFARGAFVVRAVAGLLHRFGILNSARQPEFARDFKKLLKESENLQGRRSSLALSPTSSLSSATLRPSPRILFVGVFDTIRPSHGTSTFDTSFNASTVHMRHAVALHEDWKVPDLIYPEDFYRNKLKDSGRSFTQAWFIGSHADMGGTSKKSGLALYPLQWLLLEARTCGVLIDALIGSELSAVVPKGDDKVQGAWSCKAANGTTVTMHDFRYLHRIDDTSVRLGGVGSRIASSLRPSKHRTPFDANGTLRGYCDWAPQGTIIHPSVYLLLDEYVNVVLVTKEVRLQRSLNDWRERIMGSQNGVINTGFWLDEDDDEPDPGAIRVLVCGNTGVGKSTLINKVFGVDVTQSSDRARGIHDVQEEITFEGRPDLIVHDSGGFEAGADDEFIAIEAFLKAKSEATDVADRLHVIWFCVDINSARTLQTATEKLFKAVSKYAKDVPIMVIATKKDDYLDIEFGTHRKMLKKEGKPFDEEACERYAEERLRERVETIQAEMQSVEGGRLDACLAISQDDEASIAHLSKETSKCFDTDKVRLLYIRAQVSRIDLKIDLAMCEVTRLYKRLLRAATGSGFTPFGATLTRKLSNRRVIKCIINCFGLPTVSADAAVDALQTNVWDTLGSSMMLVLAEAFQAFGVIGSVFAMGIPVWAFTGAVNSSYVVPATCRLFLTVACDLVFVLARSFKEVTFRTSGQPNERDVVAAARNYKVRGYATHIHHNINQLVPRRNLLASYKAEKIRVGLEEILLRYKDKLMGDVDLPLKIERMRITDDSSSTTSDVASTNEDAALLTDFKEAQSTLAELDGGRPVAELEGSNEPAVELPGDDKIVELPATERKLVETPTTEKVIELDAGVKTKLELEQSCVR